MKTNPVTLSLIIPAFNEENRIGPSLEQILRFCNAQPYGYEVIIVDDGSTDGTLSLIRERFGNHPQLRILRQPVRWGKGAAVQEGMRQSRGDYVIFTDADLAVPITTLPEFLDKLKNGYDIAIGSRRIPGSNIEVHQPWLREALGKVFIWLSNALLNLDHSDITCGFKGFRRDIAGRLCSQQRVHNWSFD
ncbi:MAG TPA: glycosyltransferase, partial [Terriglobales bacterium]|nr:glycosyltransferase [Terriglobales bacterium]